MTVHPLVADIKAILSKAAGTPKERGCEADQRVIDYVVRDLPVLPHKITRGDTVLTITDLTHETRNGRLYWRVVYALSVAGKVVFPRGPHDMPHFIGPPRALLADKNGSIERRSEVDGKEIIETFRVDPLACLVDHLFDHANRVS